MKNNYKNILLTFIFIIASINLYSQSNTFINNLKDYLKQSETYYVIPVVIGIMIFIFLFITFFIYRKKNKKIKTVLSVLDEERKNAEKAKRELEESTEQTSFQAAIAEILKNVTGESRTINKFLQDALDILLGLSWLNVLPKGTVFLKDEKDNLKITAEKGFNNTSDALQEKEISLDIKMQDEVLGTLNLYTDKDNKISDFQMSFLITVCDTLASVVNRKKSQDELLNTKEELEKKNSAIRKYMLQYEQKTNESEILNQALLVQKKNVENKNKQVEQFNYEIQKYSKEIEKQFANQEALNQKLFAQNMESEQKKTEVEQYLKELKEQSVELVALNQKLFAQNMEVEQQKTEVEQYSKQLEEQSKEQEILNQKLFAQNMEVGQRKTELEQYSKQLEVQSKEQEKLNQQLFAQTMEVEQRNIEVEQYSKQLEEQSKEQEALNQKLFAQNMEVEQRNTEVEQYSKEIENLKEEAEDAYKHISDSINYAKTIQETLLPSENDFHKYFSDNHMVYFKPKESIGGDFYFITKVEDTIVLAVADCTGHGVPGALITMLGITFLQDITERNQVDTTGEALGILRKKIKDTFKSYGRDIQNKNGMDIAMCALNTKTNIMQYSGAFVPLIIFRNNELLQYRATRNPIGFYPVEKEFETQEIQLQNEDIIYLFSDGYADQTGGPNNRKFYRKQFHSILSDIHKFPMTKQKEFLNKIMQKWIGNNSQVDDMTILGFKWKY